MKQRKDSKWVYVLVSILIAASVWMFVRIGEDPEMENRASGVPVTVAGDRVLENQGLMIESISHETVSLTWKGRWGDVGQLSRNNVSVTVDVTRISEPGTYELDYTPNYPNTVASSAISLTRSEPGTITVTVAKVYSETFDIHPVLKGSVAEGYQAGEFLVEPERVLISGTQEKVSGIEQVQVVLEQKDMTSSFSGELPLLLLDAQGNAIDHAGLTFSTEQPYVVLPIVVTREIPLTVDFIAGGGATEDNVTYTISPDAIIVSGPEEEMANLDEISLGSIDLAQIMESYSGQYPIYLPSGLENVSGITEADVEVTVEGLTTRSFEVENIELQNVPKGYTAALSTQQRTIVLRGPAASLDKVYASQIKIVVDLADLGAGTGSYNVPAKVYLYTSSDVGVIGQYSVVVKLSK